jgi:hypothetical protein
VSKFSSRADRAVRTNDWKAQLTNITHRRAVLPQTYICRSSPALPPPVTAGAVRMNRVSPFCTLDLAQGWVYLQKSVQIITRNVPAQKNVVGQGKACR